MIRILALVAAVAVAGAHAASAQVMAIGAAEQGSLLYAAGVAVAKVLNEKFKIQARVQPFAGSSTYAPMLSRGELDFGLINVDDAMTAYRGIDNFAGRPNPNLRIMAVMFPLPFGALVPADSPIKTMKDLKGARMPSEYAGMSTARKLQDAILATADLSTADMKGVPVANLFQGIEALTAGRVDAAVIGPGTARVQIAQTDLQARGGIRYLSLDDSPEALAKLQKIMQARFTFIQPAKHLPGIIGPTNVMLYSVFLMTNDKLDGELAYKLAAALHDNKAMIAEIHPAMQGFEPARMTEKSETPYHDGAIKYYHEIGQWPPKD